MSRNLIALSINHHTAPVEVRERVALDESETRHALSHLKDGVLQEVVILSTCNRTELYGLPADPAVNAEYLIDFLLKAKNLPPAEEKKVREQFQQYEYHEAVTHLCEVTGGVDSQIIGDQQIFSQVKDAFRLSQEAGTAGKFMQQLADSAYHAAKRIKTETGIGVGAATISYAAVELSRKVYDDLRGRSALVIGAGETAELAAKHLCERKIGTLRVVNRTVENGQALLRRVRDGQLAVNDSVHPLSDLLEALIKSDIVISSTAAPEYIITKKIVTEAVRRRSSSQPLLLLDIAVPRDIDPEASSVPNVFVKDIDDLRSIVDQNVERRKADIPKAKTIVQEELSRFLEQQSKHEVGPIIRDLRSRFEQVRKEELARNAGRFSEEQLAVIDDMTRKMINRLLHSPTIALKEQDTSIDDLGTRIELVRTLFSLNNDEDAASTTDTP